MPINVFLSVEPPNSEVQKRFVGSIENYLARQGLRARTLERHASDENPPLKLADDLMESCAGSLVIALEHVYLDSAFQRRGLNNSHAISGALAAPWSQIEAALSYARRLPLLVIKEDCVRGEGMLDGRQGWYVLSTKLDARFLDSPEFAAAFARWRSEVRRRAGWFGYRH